MVRCIFIYEVQVFEVKIAACVQTLYLEQHDEQSLLKNFLDMLLKYYTLMLGKKEEAILISILYFKEILEHIRLEYIRLINS